jgi:hypothetical protein
MKTSAVILTCLLSLDTLVCCSAANAVDISVGTEAVQKSQESPAISEISSHLTRIEWGYSEGEPRLITTFLYTFASDGTYKLQILSDVDLDPYIGEWRLTLDSEGKVHLILKNKFAMYHVPPQDSIIRYEKETNSMLVSGGNLRGTVKLWNWGHNKPGK